MKPILFVRKHRVGFLFGTYLTFCLISISISTQTFILRPKEFGLSIFAIFQKGVSSVQTFFSETVTSIATLRSLRQEYDQVIERLRNFEKVEKQLALLEEENRTLREILKFSQSITYENIPARIIGKDPRNYFSTLTIDKGSLHGIERNMPVIAIQGGRRGLVGKIVEAGFNASIVQPIYDPSAYVAARLAVSRYVGLVSGSLDERIYMHYVKKFARINIQTGEMVLTSGLNSIFPPDIPIGILNAIHVREYDTSLLLELEPIIDFRRLEHVFVLKIKQELP